MFTFFSYFFMLVTFFFINSIKFNILPILFQTNLCTVAKINVDWRNCRPAVQMCGDNQSQYS